MPNQGSSNKGIALFLTLFTILVVVILSNIVLNIMLNHTRLTHHQISRIQAYYASIGGENYALNRLRVGNDPLFPVAGNYTRNICNTNPICNIVPPPGFVCHVNDVNLPCSVLRVAVVVGAPGSGPAGTQRVAATSDYTFTQ